MQFKDVYLHGYWNDGKEEGKGKRIILLIIVIVTNIIVAVSLTIVPIIPTEMAS